VTKRGRRSALLLCALASLASGGLAAPAQPAPVGTFRIAVGYTQAGFAGAPALERSLDLRRVTTLPQLDVDVVEVGNDRANGALAALRADPIVRYAQRDTLVHALRVPNDALWSLQWSPVKTDAVHAWDLSTGSAQIVVADVDTGVDSTQPDLQGKLVPGNDFVNGDSDPADDNGHGTGVAGIIAADTNNDVGVAGYCWSCRVMPVKVLGADGSGFSSTVAQGVLWATDHGARVINLSLGSPVEDLTVAASAQYASAHGALVVAAAGNDSASIVDYPAAIPGVLSVSASDQNDQLYGFSNSGGAVAAPGENTTTALGEGFESFLGTSSASPVVSGIAALLFSSVPDATPAAVTEAIEKTAVPISGVSYGRVDAFRALGTLLPPAAPASSTSPTRQGSSGHATTKTRTKTFAGGLTQAKGSESFKVTTTAAGVLRATLTVRKGGSTSVRLRLIAADGKLVASVSGRKVLRLQVRVRRGSYRLVVSSTPKRRLRFTLTVKYPKAA
jgi:subtilisin family serine protease